MKTVTILDTETTGLSPTEDKCIEVAVVHYSLEHASVIKSFAGLIAIEGENEAERVNHIPTGLLHDSGSQAECAWQAAATVAQGSEAVLAHNSDFDHAWVPEGSALLDLPWIDTLALDWPMQSKPGSALITLALEHGLGVVDPHRALSDCILLARMLTRCHELGHDLNALLAPGLRPRSLFQAMVSYDDRELAKMAGFKWEGDRKRWVRKMPAEDAAKLPFRTRELAG